MNVFVIVTDRGAQAGRRGKERGIARGVDGEGRKLCDQVGRRVSDGC